jgi:alpha-mannosidase
LNQLALALAFIGLITFRTFSEEAAAGAGERQPVQRQALETFWLIPHTHWEGAVFKTREAYLAMGLPNILTALRLLREHPNYRFVLDQVAYFKPFLERYPEEAPAFRRFVAEGRLQIVGGLNVMPDDNLPSGESFVRQMLYAKGYCREALGVEVKVGWLLDTFGHNAQIPQLLRLGGYESFWFFRGVEDRKTMPSEFLWQGLDGTRIPAFWLPFAYGHLYGPPADLGGFNNFVKQRFNDLAPYSRGPDRVGLAGVDVSEPELHVADLVEQYDKQPDRPFNMRIGLPTEFEAVVAQRTNRPVITGERNPLFQGIYSSRIELKQRMREMERLLTTVEKAGALASLLVPTQGDEQIWRAWEPVLFNVTHDLSSGVMTDPVYEDTIRGYDFSRRIGEELLNGRLEQVQAKVDSRGPGIAVAVFNTLGWTRTDAAEVEVGFAEGKVLDFDVLDDRKEIVPAQLVQTDRFRDGGLKRIKFAFLAREVPALGYRVFHVVPNQTTGSSHAGVLETNATNEFENEFYRTTFDLKSGALTGLRVKSGGWDALGAPANIVAKEPDNGDFWELYRNLDGFQNVVMKRPMSVPGAGQAQFSDKFTGEAGRVRRGPVFSEFEVQHPFGSNGFSTSMRLYAGLPRIDFKTRILNQEAHVRYRLIVPTSIQNGQGIHEIPFGAIERPESQEFPAQNWVNWGNSARGLALLNRALPGNNISEGTMMLSLMRSTRIQSYGEDGSYERGMSSESGLELGKELTFDYALYPHSSDWREARTFRAGLEFNNPLIVRKLSTHNGPLPARWGLVEISPENVVLSAVKPSKDGATIIRVYEAAGRATADAAIKLNIRVRDAREANLMEDSGKELKVQNDKLRFELHPFEIKTFKLSLQSLR